VGSLERDVDIFDCLTFEREMNLFTKSSEVRVAAVICS